MKKRTTKKTDNQRKEYLWVALKEPNLPLQYFYMCLFYVILLINLHIMNCIPKYHSSFTLDDTITPKQANNDKVLRYISNLIYTAILLLYTIRIVYMYGNHRHVRIHKQVQCYMTV